jgi:hypothetical protein
MPTPIHVMPDENFDDWVVRDGNCELGHYPTREAAEQIAEAVAQRRGDDLVVHLPDGTTSRKSFARGWTARRLRR